MVNQQNELVSQLSVAFFSCEQFLIFFDNKFTSKL